MTRIIASSGQVFEKRDRGHGGREARDSNLRMLPGDDKDERNEGIRPKMGRDGVGEGLRWS